MWFAYARSEPAYCSAQATAVPNLVRVLPEIHTQSSSFFLCREKHIPRSPSRIIWPSISCLRLRILPIYGHACCYKTAFDACMFFFYHLTRMLFFFTVLLLVYIRLPIMHYALVPVKLKICSALHILLMTGMVYIHAHHPFVLVCNHNIKRRGDACISSWYACMIIPGREVQSFCRS